MLMSYIDSLYSMATPPIAWQLLFYPIPGKLNSSNTYMYMYISAKYNQSSRCILVSLWVITNYHECAVLEQQIFTLQLIIWNLFLQGKTTKSRGRFLPEFFQHLYACCGFVLCLFPPLRKGHHSIYLPHPSSIPILSVYNMQGLLQLYSVIQDSFLQEIFNCILYISFANGNSPICSEESWEDHWEDGQFRIVSFILAQYLYRMSPVLFPMTTL